MTNSHYVLVKGKVVLCPDEVQWAKWMSTNDRLVATDTLPSGTVVITSFEGQNFGYSDTEPRVFLTKVLSGPLTSYTAASPTLERARQTQIEVLEHVKKEESLRGYRA